MQTKTPKTKLYILIALVLVFAGISAYTLSGGQLLQGVFTPNPYTSTTPNTIDVVVTTSIEDAAEYAEMSNLLAASFATEAAQDATDAETAWNNNDRNGLGRAQSEADSDGDAAKQAADNATEYQSQAQAFYDSDYSQYQKDVNDVNDAKEAKNLAWDSYLAKTWEVADYKVAWEDAVANRVAALRDPKEVNGFDASDLANLKLAFDNCMSTDSYNESGSAHSDTCLDVYETTLDWASIEKYGDYDYYTDIINEDITSTKSAYEVAVSTQDYLQDKYNEASQNYDAAYAVVLADNEQLSDDRDFLYAANDSADSAADYASQGLSSKNLANSFQVANCTELTLSPTSYEMAATDSSADFDLTVGITTDEATSAWLKPKNLMAFSLIELETTVTVTGTIKAYPVTTYETQTKWFGSLVFRTNGSGTFKEGTGTPANPLTVSKTDSSDSTISFSGGVAGNLIKVVVKDEQYTCSASLEITQADAPAITLTESDSSTAITEGGATDSYTVALNTAPTADVTVTITPDAQATVSPSTLTFTSSNWSTAQTVTVTAVDDSVVEGDHSAVMSHSASSSDTDYNAITINSITASVTDNDSTTYSVTITESDDSTDVTEGGATDTYTAVLTAAPTADVTVTVSPDSQVTVSPAALTFTSSNWSTAQTVTVTAVEDDIEETGQTGTITHSTSSSDSNYNGISVDSVIAKVSDPLDASSYTLSTDEQAEILSSTAYDCSDPFTDMTAHWAEDMVCRLFQAGIVSGRTNVSFEPDDYITRAEWVKVLDLIFGHSVDEAEGEESDFLDAQGWYEPYIIIAEMNRTIRPEDFGAYFYPNENITRGDAILYAIRMAGKTDYDYDVEALFSDVQNEDYYAYALAVATETTVTDPETGEPISIIEGYSDGTFRGENPIARSEAMAIAIRIALAFGVASEGFEDYAGADQ
jgi:hypothetical protein